MNHILRRLTTGAIAASLIAAPLALVASSAEAATTTCSYVHYDAANGGATATCKGTTPIEIKVVCNAVWPFTSWTKYSAPWSPGASGKSFAWGSSVFPSCPSPATSSITYVQA